MKDKSQKTTVIRVGRSRSRSRSRTAAKDSSKKVAHLKGGDWTNVDSLLISKTSESTEEVCNVSNAENRSQQNTSRSHSDIRIGSEVVVSRSFRSTSSTRGRRATRSKSTPRKKAHVAPEEDESFLQKRISSLNKMRSSVISHSNKARRSRVNRANVSNAWKNSGKPKSERSFRQSRLIGLGWRGTKVQGQDHNNNEECADGGKEEKAEENGKSFLDVFSERKKLYLEPNNNVPSNSNENVEKSIRYEPSPKEEEEDPIKSAADSTSAIVPNTEAVPRVSQDDETSPVVTKIKHSLSTGMVSLNELIENVKPKYNNKTSTVISSGTSIDSDLNIKSDASSQSNKSSKSEKSSKSNKSSKSEKSQRRRWKRKSKTTEDTPQVPSMNNENAPAEESCHSESSQIVSKIMQSWSSSILQIGHCFDSTCHSSHHEQGKTDEDKAIVA